MANERDAIIESVNETISQFGFEAHPFKIDWYNKLVEEKFHLPYPADTFALTIISNPRMFEKAFIPFLCEHYKEGNRDPIDLCVQYYIKKIQTVYPNTDLMYDFEMTAFRHPRFLAQTGAHISGAAYYYQKKDVINNPWGEKQIFGLCIHPKYGGWFAIRAAVIFKDLQFPDLIYKAPVDVLSSQESRINLLEMLNIKCDYWKSRDIIEVSERYSEDAIKYFKTNPKERKKIIDDILANRC